MNEQVRSYLIELARKKFIHTIYYQKLSDVCSLELNMINPRDRVSIGEILGDISKFENKNERPLLSALVVLSGVNKVGDGFYKLAEELGYGEKDYLKKTSFAEKQVDKCIMYWKDKDNYQYFK